MHDRNRLQDAGTNGFPLPQQAFLLPGREEDSLLRDALPQYLVFSLVKLDMAIQVLFNLLFEQKEQLREPPNCE